MKSRRALAEQVEQQRQDLAAMRAEIAALRRSRDTEPDRATAPADHGARPARTLSRRGLLTAAPAAVVGAAATSLLQAAPAAAAAGSPLVLGSVNDAGTATTSLTSAADTTLKVTGAVEVQDVGYTDLPLLSMPYLSVHGSGVPSGVHTTVVVTAQPVEGRGTASGETGNALACTSSGHSAIVASASSVTTAEGITKVGVAVEAAATGTGTGLASRSTNGRALDARSTGATSRVDAGVVSTAGLGRAIYATSTNPANTQGTITGVNNGTGAGLYASQTNAGASGAAVVGVASSKGRGGSFRGGAAAVTLVPSAATTHPTSGNAGDLFVDSAKRLWFCKGASTWAQIV